MDGTVTQTNQLIYDSFNHVAEKYIRKRLTPAEIVSYFGPPELDAVKAIIGPEHITDAMDEYYRFYTDRHSVLASIYPGIREILEFLRSRNVTIGLFTGKGRITTDITLEQFGISSYFDMTVTGDDVVRHKPSGDGIRKILTHYGLTPDRVLMVGDAVADIKAARETGVDVASVVWDSYGKQEVVKLQPDFLFHDVGEFSDWIRSIYQ